MANYLTTDTDLTSVANAIRTKGGTSAQLAFPADFITAINAISGGGGGSRTESGTFTVTSGYLTSKTITHSLNTQRLYGIIWLEADENNILEARGGYSLLYATFTTVSFNNVLYNGVTLNESYTSNSTKTAAYTADAYPYVRSMKSGWTSQAASWKIGNNTYVGNCWGEANSNSEFTIETDSSNTYMRADGGAVTYHWQVWALDDWVGDS